MLLCDKVLCGKSYGFSSGHVCMWELDCKESWVLKNCCFWTVVLEKTLEGPLDCHEIKPVHSKGNQSWIFIGRTDAEAEAPILWPVDVKNSLIGKDSDAEKDWSREEKGTTENEMVGWHHRLDGHEFEQALWAGDGQGGLMCWGQWGCKESDTTGWLNWTQQKDLLYRTGNSAQCYLAAWTRGTLGGERICVFIWLRPVAVFLKLSPHCWLAILQRKIKNKIKNVHESGALDASAALCTTPLWGLTCPVTPEQYLVSFHYSTFLLSPTSWPTTELLPVDMDLPIIYISYKEIYEICIHFMAESCFILCIPTHDKSFYVNIEIWYMFSFPLCVTWVEFHCHMVILSLTFKITKSSCLSLNLHGCISLQKMYEFLFLHILSNTC